MRAEEGFQFQPFRVGNPWGEDAALRLTILRLMLTNGLDAPTVSRLFESLHSFGARCAGPYADIAATLDNPTQEPTLVQYDAWGRRVDRLVTGQGWQRLKAVAAAEGIVAESYDTENARQGQGRARLGQFARLFAFARIVMFGPVSKVVLCPVSMSDGAVRVLELHGTPAQRAFIPRLCSIDPHLNYTAGQWMTERPGGSDKGDKFVIDGFKWFSSATDGDIALALARTDPDVSKGTRGMSLFLIKIRDDETGKLNGIRVHRLKRKLGTKYLPTAELELNGCIGELVGELGRGVATISSVLNITRLYSASGAVGGLSWGLRSATAYAQTRPALGGSQLSQLPLHTDQLLKVTVLYRTFLQVFFSNALLMGASESGEATDRQKMRLRLLTPALKAFIATRASEAYLTLIESFGGQGYMEEVGMGEMLRDLTVERIWEGTPAVLSLDVLRVVTQSKGRALREFLEDAVAALSSLPAGIRQRLSKDIEQVSDAVAKTAGVVQSLDLARHMSSNDLRFTRPLLDVVMAINASVGLLEHAAWLSEPASVDPLDIVRLARLGGRDDLSAQAAQQEEMARLWISGGHGDLARLLDQLASTVQDDAGKTVRLASSSVYSWGERGNADAGVAAAESKSTSTPAASRTVPLEQAGGAYALKAKSRL
ncbi:uncharacterized protein PSFLO_00159 [Pseudozyma flocculosa]|uniref:Acyl-CoA dehydrogenase n=1 Tax=Pseudozyma flocculosa TaxID=84751 RepID=A0A5C3ER53_9BASI|nr:uncharacterized protein PSFLO_00159 [Pseudozyma flocculosa]